MKPGKDPLDLGSYRPISLLQSNVKILAKGLALRPNEVVLTTVHSEQAGFMPLKSLVVNIRLLLNMQTPADNLGHRVLLSLNTRAARYWLK